jgi:hypothetical protein
MAFVHALLGEAEAGPGAWKVVRPEAPAPLRTMVAKGLAPLPPRDLVVALYCLWVDATSGLGEQAARTVEGLPPAILGGALDDPKLPAGVLDFLGRKHPRNEHVLERVVRHPNVADATLAGVSRMCPETICDVLADNQARWLSCPAIVEALYQNPNCRMSVAQRMLELAVREGLDLKLPNIEEIRQALDLEKPEVPAAEPERDEVFRDVSDRARQTHENVVERLRTARVDEAIDPDGPMVLDDLDDLAGLDALLSSDAKDDMSLPLEDEQDAEADAEEAPETAEVVPDPAKLDRITVISKLRPMEKIRLALLGNAFERAVLIRDSNKAVCMSAIKSPKIKENEVVAYSANRSLPYDVIRYIALRRDWTKLYAIKLNLVLNPKTPMSTAMGFLGHLHQHDVRKVARSKNIPSALATAAKRRGEQRR